MPPTGSQIDLYQALARQLRADSIRCSTAAGSGHPTSSLSAQRPTVIVTKTVKGKGAFFLENKEGWHGKALDSEQAERILAEIGAVASRTFPTLQPEPWRPRELPAPREPKWKTYAEPLATRKAYGEALAALGTARANVVVLDAEVSNSTHAEDFQTTAPERFFEMHIAGALRELARTPRRERDTANA